MIGNWWIRVLQRVWDAACYEACCDALFFYVLGQSWDTVFTFFMRDQKHNIRLSSYVEKKAMHGQSLHH